jgi:hypothetical protein
VELAYPDLMVNDVVSAVNDVVSAVPERGTTVRVPEVGAPLVAKATSGVRKERIKG